MLLALILACATETPQPLAPATPPPALKIDPVAAAASAVQNALAPSPDETRVVLQRAGIGVDIAGLVPNRTLSLDTSNKDVLAVRTGVYLSDTILTLKEASKEDLTARMDNVHKGLEGMGAGAGLLATIKELTDRVRNDAISRDELLFELDGTIVMAVPEQGVGPADRTGPLLQAGAWVATTHLVAKAILQSGKLEAADTLLRQKGVVDYFHKYLQGDGSGKAQPAILSQLEATLTALGEIAGHAHITEEDVKAIEVKTEEILGLM